MPFRHNSQSVSVAIIGRTHADEFRRLIRQIQNSPVMQITGQFDTIAEAIGAGLAEQLPADVVIILQAFSDEYSEADAGQLIGRMLFRRVLCCYGPWCLSDGRTHEIWPVVARVPVSSAWNVLKQEVRNLWNGVEGLLPMAAAEEVFAHRAALDFDNDDNDNHVILIVSDDLTLRKTIAEMLRRTANQVFDCGTAITQIEIALSKLKAAETMHSKISVLLDFDGQEQRENELRTLIRSMCSSSVLIRLTSFPHAVPQNGQFDQIVDKLEVASQLLARS